MTRLTILPEWHALQKHHEVMADYSVRDGFDTDPARFENFSLQAVGLLLDYSKNRITIETLSLLYQLADAVDLPQAIEQLFTGHAINNTEHRAALHTSLRNPSEHSILIDGKNIAPSIRKTLAQMRKVTDSLRNGSFVGYGHHVITDVVNIGIGGSDLGPKFVTEALAPYATTSPRCHFVSNIDGTHITQVLEKLNPTTTLFIISSKSFTTMETLTNANTAKQWIVKAFGTSAAVAKHFLAITAHHDRALSFGITANNIFEIWDWVGGRYSLWSAIGLPIAIHIGMDRFEELLAGAHAMDQHFRNTPWSQNMPVILALLGIWYANFFDTQTHAIIPYSHHLKLLPAYLQQTDMESNGKSMTRKGHPVDYSTGSVVWGEAGCNGQHAFHQLFHQGTHLIPIDFIICTKYMHSLHHHHHLLFADCLSQSQALMQGKTEKEVTAELETEGFSPVQAKQLAPHKTIPGNRPSNTLVLSELSPYTLGSLLALYEHKVFVQGIIWDVNSFDQWGVETGKQLASSLMEGFEQGKSIKSCDSSTRGLSEYYLKARKS